MWGTALPQIRSSQLHRSRGFVSFAVTLPSNAIPAGALDQLFTCKAPSWELCQQQKWTPCHMSLLASGSSRQDAGRRSLEDAADWDVAKGSATASQSRTIVDVRFRPSSLQQAYTRLLPTPCLPSKALFTSKTATTVKHAHGQSQWGGGGGGGMRITLWYPKFNGSNFGLPPSSIHEMTEQGGKKVWTMTYAHRPHYGID